MRVVCGCCCSSSQQNHSTVQYSAVADRSPAIVHGRRRWSCQPSGTVYPPATMTISCICLVLWACCTNTLDPIRDETAGRERPRFSEIKPKRVEGRGPHAQQGNQNSNFVHTVIIYNHGSDGSRQAKTRREQARIRLSLYNIGSLFASVDDRGSFPSDIWPINAQGTYKAQRRIRSAIKATLLFRQR